MKIQMNKIYWIPTYSKKDLHANGSYKLRPTFILKELGKVHGKRIFLVASTNSKHATDLKIRNAEIEVQDYVSEINGGKDFVKGIISPINIRMVGEDAFKINRIEHPDFFVQNHHELRTKCLDVLLKINPRRFDYYLDLMRRGMYFKNKNELNHFLIKGQFNKHELKAKGFYIPKQIRRGTNSIYSNKWDA